MVRTPDPTLSHTVYGPPLNTHCTTRDGPGDGAYLQRTLDSPDVVLDGRLSTVFVVVGP
jgi:hypothetical protein